MNFLQKRKGIKKSRLIKYIFLMFILIYGLSFSILISVAINSVFNSIKSLKVPNGYFLSNLDPLDPKFEISFNIENKGLNEITDFYVDISEDILYFDNKSLEVKKGRIFSKQIYIGNIKSGDSYDNIICGNLSDFNIEFLERLTESVNTILDIQESLTIIIKGRYFYRLIPFKILIDSLCLNCGN